MLDKLDRTQLQELIQQFIQLNPTLERIVYRQKDILETNQQFSNSHLKIIAKYMAIVDVAFDNFDPDSFYEYDDGYEEISVGVLDAVGQLRQTFKNSQILEQDELTELLECYAYTLAKANAFCDTYPDISPEDIVYDVQKESMHGLYALLKHQNTSSVLYENILSILRNEIASQRFEFDEEFYAIYETFPSSEKDSLLDLIIKVSEACQDYRKAHYIKAVLELRAEAISDEDKEQFFRSQWNKTDFIVFLVHKGRITEALRHLKNNIPHSSSMTIQLAFEEAGALSNLEGFALKNGGLFNNQYWLWLYDHYRNTERLPQALKLAKHAFDKAVDHRNVVSFLFQEWLTRIRQDSPQWPKDRARIIKKLEENSHLTLLAQFFIQEGMATEAFQIIQNDNVIVSENFLLKLAKYPELSIVQVRHLVLLAAERLIKQRNRKAYTQASEALKFLQGRQGKKITRKELETYFPELKKLPSLKEELQKVGL